MREHFDVVVVGAGSSGGVTAARLSENSDISVLLLEAGGPDANPDIHVPANAWKVWMTDDDWWLPTVPQSGQAGRSLYLPRGKMLGGSSSINGTIYIRGSRADYDHWAYLGNPGWDYESVLPYFRKSEDYHGGAGRYHGAGGPLTVSRITDPNPLTEAFLAAGQGIGLPLNDDFAGESELGLLNERVGDELFFCAAPRQAVAGGDGMEAGIGGIPVDREADARWIIRRVFRNRSDQDGIDAHLASEALKFRTAAWLTTGLGHAGCQHLLADTDWHHLEAWNGLQFVVVGHGDGFAVDGGFCALIEEGEDRDFVDLRERVVELGFDDAIWPHRAAGVGG